MTCHLSRHLDLPTISLTSRSSSPKDISHLHHHGPLCPSTAIRAYTIVCPFPITPSLEALPSHLQLLSQARHRTSPSCSSSAVPVNRVLPSLPVPRASSPAASTRPWSAPCASTAKASSRCIARIVRLPFCVVVDLRLTPPDACRQRLGAFMCPNPKEPGVSKYCADRTFPSPSHR